jgi:hypothetical protein
MLKVKDADTSALSPQAFAKQNSKILYDEALPEDIYAPLATPETEHLTSAELTQTIKHAFKANRSSGLSQMPLQILKHMGTEGIKCLASFLNTSAID